MPSRRRRCCSPRPPGCRSDRFAVARLPLRLAVYAPEKDAPVVEALLNVLNAQGVLSGLSMTGDRESADVVCSVEGTPAGTGEGYEARLDAGKEGRGVLHFERGEAAQQWLPDLIAKGQNAENQRWQ